MLTVRNLVKNFGGLTATDDLSLQVRDGELHAIIGPNGAGKTTLIHQLAGEYFPDSGEIIFDGKPITRTKPHARALVGLGRSYQISSVFSELTVIENVLLSLLAHQGHSFKFWKPILAFSGYRDKALAALETVGLAGLECKVVEEMAHGERRQLELAMAIINKPKLLLLDEPMAGMSHRESEKVIELLSSLKGQYAILLVEHDMDAVFTLADRITVLVYGRPIATGTPDEIRNNAQVLEAYLGAPEEDN
ncbi:MAG: ABC transporter ATP-binding protein [Pusillimonas sp.]|nr:ABC transporter ATP-binding protein [Pusillimonas sp.]MBC43226.1 ABC transporter ATP-binding protein [Pusillimonas sp.]HCP78170.1 ABC transporter ATP-binding protein [Pusillimonas sp.]|tara:strand:+ start:28158 stop:28904 length:747 start_codon:yes stop_codon:yes gene_type:complete